MKIGVLSSAFGELGYQDFALKLNQYRFPTVHLNLKTLKDVDTRAGKLSTGLANHIAEEFDRRCVKIPALGGYTNLINPNVEERRDGIQRLKEQIRFARDFGASIVATETGTMNTVDQFEGHPENQSESNWELLKSVVKDLVEEAEKWGVFIALEGFTKNVINTPVRMQAFLQEISSHHLGIVMDPCNYIDESNMHKQEEVMSESFERLGDRILLAHAKDFTLDENGKMVQPGAGTGKLNYSFYLDLLYKQKPFVNLFLEHLREEQMFDSMGVVNNALNNIENA